MVLRLFFIITLFCKCGISASYNNGVTINKSGHRSVNINKFNSKLSNGIPRGGSSSGSSLQATMSDDLTTTKAATTTISTNNNDHGPLRVLFLSSDTGGGHRASAESLAKQFDLQFPGTIVDVVDVWTLDGCLPYRTIVPTYTHFSAHPFQWKVFFHCSNARIVEAWSDFHSKLICERKIRKRIASYDPDVVISVHPTMNLTPTLSVRKISKLVNRHIPIYTVVTDLGSAHCMWFKKQVDKLFVPSERLREVARKRRIPDDKLDLIGLPIRNDFSVEAEKLKDRSSPEGKAYQAKIKKELGIDPDRPMVLVMGGGEGTGGLSSIVDGLYASFVNNGVDATICVVCAKNTKLKSDLEIRDWDNVVIPAEMKKILKMEKRNLRKQKRRGSRIRKLFRRKRKNNEELEEATILSPSSSKKGKGNVAVIGLGYVTKMAEYMVAADVLVSKAGPGTIAEAASLGLPCMLTSFLPGQEAGNVEFVIEKGFGKYCKKPTEIGQTVADWVQDENLRADMNAKALEASNANAAAEIIHVIGTEANSYRNLSIENSADGKRISTHDVKIC